MQCWLVHAIDKTGTYAPENGWTGKGVINDTGETMLSAKGCNCWDVGHLQQGIADSFYVEHLHPRKPIMTTALGSHHKSSNRTAVVTQQDVDIVIDNELI